MTGGQKSLLAAAKDQDGDDSISGNHVTKKIARGKSDTPLRIEISEDILQQDENYSTS